MKNRKMKEQVEEECSHGTAYAQAGRQRHVWGRDTVFRVAVLSV